MASPSDPARRSPWSMGATLPEGSDRPSQRAAEAQRSRSIFSSTAARLADARFRPLVPHAGRAGRGAAERSHPRVALQPAEVLVADLDRLLVRSGAKDDA